MQDKLLMQDMLMLEKGVCDLYMHGPFVLLLP